MLRLAVILAGLLATAPLHADDLQGKLPSFDYDTARAHEIKPHRGTIPTEGIRDGSSQLSLKLNVSPLGDVTHAEAGGSPDDLKYWPQLQGEVYQWRFTPFEKDGKPVAAEIDEYINLVPPERLPRNHVPAPVIRSDSKVTVALERTGCLGSCPAYTVTASTDGILFDGGGNVVATGKHTDRTDADAVRELAKKFVAADFYSMDPSYSASVTDCPTQVLTLTIDGNQKQVVDYMGTWVGMPEIVDQLEEDVDELARTDRWIKGSDGLVQLLKDERFNFKTFEAQVILKAAAQEGQAATVHELLDAGIPLQPLPAPKRKEKYMSVPFENIGWLSAASSHPDTLAVLIAAGASKEDQSDKDLALVGAARSGDVQAVRALISYGANPKTNLNKLTITKSGGGITLQGPGSGSILIFAAESGNPDMVRELLRYKPNIEAKDREGKTAMFAAGDYRDGDIDGARVECVRLLAAAGANVNASDDDGNTPLHETFLTDVEEELLDLGANVNARNNDGETPIFTTVDDDAIPLFIQHGADLTIRNNKGETVFDAAKRLGPHREEVLREAAAAAASSSASPAARP